MARPRLPQAKAEASGAVLKNAGRFVNRKALKRTRPLGDPYALMTEIERGYWAEYATELPWLHSGHRVILRMACRLSARLDTDEDMPVAAMQTLSAMLSKLGATPTDETKVNHAGGDEEDPSESFFSRPN